MKRIPLVGGLFGSKTLVGKPSHIYFNHLVRNGIPCPSQSLGTIVPSVVSLTGKINRIKNIHVLVSTQHPDDYILNMINGICGR